MLAAKLSADLRKARPGEHLAKIHRDLTRKRDASRVVFRFEVGDLQAKMSGDGPLDHLDRDTGDVFLDDRPERFVRELEAYRHCLERCVRHQSYQRSFELSDVRLDLACDKQGYVVGQLGVREL